jgi:hypothetical protein
MKRPSCKWKGQTVANEESTQGAGSPISRMPQTTEGGLQPTHQPKSPTRHEKYNTDITFHISKNKCAILSFLKSKITLGLSS